MSAAKYTFEWSDFRRGFSHQRRLEYLIDLKNRRTTSLIDVPTETLCNLWFVKWGKKAVNAEDVMDFNAGDSTLEVMQELANRGLVSVQTLRSIETNEEEHYYVLRNPHANR